MELQQSRKQAIVLGATGLIGSQLLRMLDSIETYEKIRVIARKPPFDVFSEKVEWLVNDFSDHQTFRSLVKGDDLFVTMGSTMAKAGSKEAFRSIDFQLTFQLIKAGAINGASQLLLVSSVGADPNSLFFYNRVKGELEQAVLSLPFWAVHILRPSMLLGERSESRPLEYFGQFISRGMNAVAGRYLGQYQPVEATAVAAAMIHYSRQLKQGHFFHASDEISTFGS